MPSQVSLAMRISPRRGRDGATKAFDTQLEFEDERSESPDPSAGSASVANTPPPSLLQRLKSPFDEPVVSSPIRLLDRIQRMDQQRDVQWSGETRSSPLINRLSSPGAGVHDNGDEPLEDRSNNLQPAFDRDVIHLKYTEHQENKLLPSHSLTSTTTPSVSVTRPSTDPATPSKVPQSQTDVVETTPIPPDLLPAASPDSEASVAGILHFADENHETDESGHEDHDKLTSRKPLEHHAAPSPKSLIDLLTAPTPADSGQETILPRELDETSNAPFPSSTAQPETVGPPSSLADEPISDVPPPPSPLPENRAEHSGVTPKLTSHVTPRLEYDMDKDARPTISGNRSQSPIPDVSDQSVDIIMASPSESTRPLPTTPTPPVINSPTAGSSDCNLSADMALLGVSMNVITSAGSCSSASASIVASTMTNSQATNVPWTQTGLTNVQAPTSPLPASSVTALHITSPIAPPVPIPFSNTHTTFANQSIIEEFRAKLIPVVIQNAVLRRGQSGPAAPTADQVRAVLTDQRCKELLEMNRDTLAQIVARKASNLDGAGAGAVAEVHVESQPNSPSHETPADPIPPNPVSANASIPLSPPPQVPTSPTSSVPTATSTLPVPMRRRSINKESRDHARFPSVVLDYGSVDPPSSSEHASSKIHSPPPPYAERTEPQGLGVSSEADPVSQASEERGAKRVRRTSVDDVHSAASWPSHESAQPTLIRHELATLTKEVDNTKARQVDGTSSQPLPQTTVDGAQNSTENIDTTSNAPIRPVPGVWLAKVGLAEPDIMDLPLEIGGNLRHNPLDSVTLHLICLPTKLATETYANLTAASPEVVANAMWPIKTTWPLGGKLIVQVNHEQSWGRSWLPVDLKIAGLTIDVTAHLRPGSNNVRFILLGDLSEYMFVLHASRAAGSSQAIMESSATASATSVPSGLKTTTSGSGSHIFNFKAK